MIDTIELPNQDLDDALDVIYDMGYEKNVEDYWEANAKLGAILFAGITEKEVLAILHELQNLGFDANIALF